MNLSRAASIVAFLLMASCAKPIDPGPPSTLEAPAPALTDLDARLLEIAAEYAMYGVVDSKFSWVRTLCREWEPPGRVSGSEDPATHGNKLYLLYARDWDAYVKGIERAQPAGQVIVKEAWESRESDKPDFSGVGFTDIDGNSKPESRPVKMEPAKKNGRWHMPTKKHALFIMLKAEDGWRYGTVSGDGKRVFQSGVISSCASCHRKVEPDSLFGLPGHPQDR